MNVLLIAPASGRWHHIGREGLFNGKAFRFSLLSLLRVAAETPDDVAVKIVDEQVDRLSFDDPVDLVGITCMTAAAPRAYRIARRFMARGVPVVLGGMHPTLNPREALGRATAVVAGDAEGVWPRVLADARAGRLNGLYRNAVPPDLKGLKSPPRNLLDRRHYATVNAVQATRGCPHGCDFCAVSAFHGATHRRRPVADVVREIGDIPEKFVLFVDDNLTADRAYARDLFRELAPLGKHWASQSTLAVADDPELVRLAAESGCIGLFVGLETFREDNLRAVNKSFNRVDGYRKAISRLHAHGIAVEAGIVFGFDGDTPDVFAYTLKMLDELQVDAIQASIFTPIPGTPAHGRMSGRIFDADPAHYDFHRVVFRPRRMSPADLQAGHDWVTRAFYRPWRIARRMLRHAARPRAAETMKYLASINLAYYGRVRRWKLRGADPARKLQAVRRESAPGDRFTAVAPLPVD